MKNQTQKVTLKKTKDCNSCVRFDTDDEKAPIKNLYVRRPHADKWESVTVTIQGEA